MIELNPVKYGFDPCGGARAFFEALGLSGQVFRCEDTWYLNRPGVGMRVLDPPHFLSELEVAGVVVIRQDGKPSAPTVRRHLNEDIRGCLGDPALKALVPAVHSLVRSPAYKVHGSIFVRRVPGELDPFETNRVLCVEPLPELPVPDPGYPHLKTLFEGVLFRTPEDRGRLLGYTVAMFTRTATKEFPILVINSQFKSAGKTKIGNALGYLLTGRPMPPAIYTADEASFEKRIGARAAEPGPTFFLFDNIRAKQHQTRLIRSQVLSAMATSKHVLAEAKYASPRPVFDPIVVLALNQALVEQDLADRVVSVTLRRPPEQDQRELNPEPMRYVEEHRRELLAEIDHILLGLTLDLSGTNKGTRFYLFETVACQAAAALGVPCTFDPKVVDHRDVQLEELVSVMKDYQGQAVGVDVLVTAIQSQPGHLREWDNWCRGEHCAASALPDRFIEAIEPYLHRPHVVRGTQYVFIFDPTAKTLRLSELP